MNLVLEGDKQSYKKTNKEEFYEKDYRVHINARVCH
jgi:hypothetical protein